MRPNRPGSVVGGMSLMVMAVVVVMAVSCRQSMCYDSNRRRSISGMEDVVDSVRSVVKAAGEVWNLENVRRAAAVRRAVREAGQNGWNLPPILSSVTSGAWIVTQMLSLLPDLGSMVVQVLATGIYMVGTGVTAVGSGLSFGSSAVEGLGRSLTTVSSVLPKVVSLLVMAGVSLMFFFPGIYDGVLNAVASTGLALAGHATTTVRGYMNDDTHWATLLDTAALLIRKLQ